MFHSLVVLTLLGNDKLLALQGAFDGVPRRSTHVSILAFGDVNFGRTVGQKILHDDVDYPFRHFTLKLDSTEIVFANLESQLSDQNGMTEDPGSNTVFTGPSEGALSLKHAGITIVSTANNHALDFGYTALCQTIDNLDDAAVKHVGTAKSRETLHEPLFVDKQGIRIAFFAVTESMNHRKKWNEQVADADTAWLLPKIRSARILSDAVVVSYHGGKEYASDPPASTIQIAEACLQAGAALFLGHHPHVVYGIRMYGERYIVPSLGNFVFFQPQKDWTQKSYGVKFTFWKDTLSTRIAFDGCVPLFAGYQPKEIKDSTVRKMVHQRIQRLSNITIPLIRLGTQP